MNDNRGQQLRRDGFGLAEAWYGESGWIAFLGRRLTYLVSGVRTDIERGGKDFGRGGVGRRTTARRTPWSFNNATHYSTHVRGFIYPYHICLMSYWLATQFHLRRRAHMKTRTTAPGGLPPDGLELAITFL